MQSISDPCHTQAHGGVAALLGESSDAVLDLSVNVNPYGPDPQLQAILAETPWRDYPDPTCQKIRQALAHKRQWDAACILVGNGANELLWAAARSVLHKGDPFTCMEPVYSEFTRAALQCGAVARPLQLCAQQDFQWDIPTLTRHVEQHRPRMVYLCNPQSPTGTYQPSTDIIRFAEYFAEVTVILDESFLSLSPRHADSSIRYPANVLRIVSMTKDHALAGLRLGYAYGSLPLIQAMQREIPAWSVNSLAQKAALFCLDNEAFLVRSRALMDHDKQVFESQLTQRGLHWLPSQSIFLMVNIPDALRLSQNLWHKHGVLVRSCTSYGYPDWWRLAIRPPAQQQRFFTAYDRELQRC